MNVLVSAPASLRVGLTYDLRSEYIARGFGEEETAEFDRDDTVDFLEKALQDLGYHTDRIGHFEQLMKRLINGDRWDIVFNIAEGLYGYGREALVPALLDQYKIPYVFSDALVLALTLHKGATKHVIQNLGIPTPGFIVASNQAELHDINLPYPLFVKPVAEGTGKGISPTSIVQSPEKLRQMCAAIWEQFNQPALVETFLPGREYTVGIVGTGGRAHVIGTMEVNLLDEAEPGVYSYINKEECETRVQYRRARGKHLAEIEAVALAAWRGLGCRDGGRIDIRLDKEDVPNFIEVNPLAGLHPEHSDLPILCMLNGISFSQLMEKIMESALLRLEKRKVVK